MNSLACEDIVLDRSLRIQDNERDEFPVLLFEPNLEAEERKVLKDLVLQNDSVQRFTELQEAFKYGQSLGISFILIVPSWCDAKTVYQNGLEGICCRQMADIEEEALQKDLFPGISDDLINSLEIKAFLIATREDLMSVLVINGDVKEVMVMRDIEEMATEFREKFAILWYAPQMQCEVKEQLERNFEINESNIYTDFQQLQQRIISPGDLPFHLILTGKDEVKAIMNDFNQIKDMLLCLYIYSDDPEILQIKNKKIFVEETFQELVPKIKEGIHSRSKLRDTFPAFATDFDTFDKSHIYNLHYYLQGFINFKNRAQAKEDFLKLARKVYQSKRISEFEEEYTDYNQNEILKWYTKESPVYKLTNNCLRIAASDSILYCRFVLRDLEEAIREKYYQESCQFSGLLYRGAYISQEEWVKLQGNIGKNIEMYGFLSTTQNVENAKNFLFLDLKKKVFITIIVPLLSNPSLNDQGFANISQDSGFQEAEILFNVKSKFRILEAGVTQINDQGKECRHLVLLYGAQFLRRFMINEKPSIQIDLKLPKVIQCGLCRRNDALFAFRQGVTEIRCIDCLKKESVPLDIPFIALNSENIEENQRVVKTIEAETLVFPQTFKLPYYGYECYNCEKRGKEKYYKWINPKTRKTCEVCSDCFAWKKEMVSNVFVLEAHPYTLWTEYETEAELIDKDHQAERKERAKLHCPSSTYLEVQEFDKCIEYEKQFISKWNRKRWSEFEKARSFHLLGRANEKLGKHLKALEYFRMALKIRLEIFGNKHPDVGDSYSSLGNVMISMGEFQEAVKFYEMAMDLCNEIYGESNQNTATVSNSLALVYQKLAKPQEALKHQKRAYDITKSVFGENHPDSAFSSNNLGLVYLSLGKHQKALECFDKALHIFRAIYGEKHEEVVNTYNSFALIYQSLGKNQKAKEYFMKALNILESIYGEKHPSAITIYTNLATTFLDLGDHQLALHYGRKALDLTKDLDGEKNPLVFFSRNNLAFIYQRIGKVQEAMDLWHEALAISKATLEKKDQEVATSYHNLAAAYQSLNQYEKAQEYFFLALEIREAIYQDKPHPEIANSHHTLAFLFRSLENYQLALYHQIKAFRIFKTFYEEEHQEIRNSKTHLLFLCESLIKNKESPLNDSVQDIFEKTFQEDQLVDIYCIFGEKYQILTLCRQNYEY